MRAFPGPANDVSKLSSKIDTFWQQVDAIDTFRKRVQKEAKQEHVAETCPRRAHVPRTCPQFNQNGTRPRYVYRSGQTEGLAARNW